MHDNRSAYDKPSVAVIAGVPLSLLLLTMLLLNQRVEKGLGSFLILVTVQVSVGILLWQVSQWSKSAPGNRAQAPFHRPMVYVLWGGLLFLLSLPHTLNPWFFFPKWVVQDSWSASWFLRFVLVGFAAGVLWIKRPSLFSAPLLAGVAAITVLGCLWQLDRATNFAPLYRIDHPAFFYRYHSFLEAFPRPGFYDPVWNAGQPVPYLVASGVWALALPWYPLLLVVPLETLFTPMIAITFLLWVPATGFLAARWMGSSTRAAWITVLLTMVPGIRFFGHILTYGTAPSIFSLGLIHLALAAVWRIMIMKDQTIPLVRTTAVLFAVSALILCWPGALLAGIPLVVASASVLQHLTRKKTLCLLGCALLLVLVLFPLALVPLRYSPIDAFLGSQTEDGNPASILKGWEQLSGLILGIHPLIILFGFCGIWLDPEPVRRRFLGVFLGVSLIMAGWGEQLWPLLQMERLILPAAFVGSGIAGRVIDSIWTRSVASGCFASRALSGCTLSLLLLGSYQGARFYGNAGPTRFQTMPEHTRELVNWLAEEVPEDTRILIAGAAVHGYGGAKAASLPLFTGREMISSDYYGFSPQLVEYQCPPRRVLSEGSDAVFRYLDLHNVSVVMTYHDSWKEALRRHPDRYVHRGDFGIVRVFSVQTSPSMLIGGAGSVTASPDRLTVTLEDPIPETLVVKYNWSDRWTASNGAIAFPSPQEFDLTFIGVHPEGARTITLEYRPE